MVSFLHLESANYTVLSFRFSMSFPCNSMNFSCFLILLIYGTISPSKHLTMSRGLILIFSSLLPIFEGAWRVQTRPRVEYVLGADGETRIRPRAMELPHSISIGCNILLVELQSEVGECGYMFRNFDLLAVIRCFKSFIREIFLTTRNILHLLWRASS